MDPLDALAILEAADAPHISSSTPPATAAGARVVRLHLDQLPRQPGRLLRHTREDCWTMLFRVGLQHHTNTLNWAALHRHSKDLSSIDIAVLDTEEALLAAQAAVQAGSVTVGPYTLPATWVRSATPPAGCVAVTVHQVPAGFIRTGLVTALLAAAGQQGQVVAEFLGGSTISGDAALSHPDANTVVAWVRPPADDPLLISLPASFANPGEPATLIQVGNRPSLAPECWQQRTAQLLAARRRVLQVVEQQQRQRQHQQEYGAQGGQQRLTPGEGVHLPDSLDMDMEQGESGPQPNPLPCRQRPQQLQHGPLQPVGRLRGNGGQDTVMVEAESEPPGASQQQQQQQQHQHQQQQQLQRPQGSLQDSGGRAAGMAATARAATAAIDPSWLQEQLDLMLRDAEMVAEEADLQFTVQLRQQLQQQFQQQFRQAIQEHHSPGQREVLCWLRQQLGAQDLGYGGSSDSEGEPEGPSCQQQQQPGPRRSGRANLGQMGAPFAAVFGPTGAGGSSSNNTSRGQHSRGDKGSTAGENSQHGQPHGPLTPSAAKPPRRKRGGRRKR